MSSRRVSAASCFLVLLPQAYAATIAGHHGDTHCERLHTRKIQHSEAHCLGGDDGTERPSACSAGCSKQPSFGVAGTTKPEFCRGHSEDGMVNLINKKCSHQGCSKRPSFGVAGTTKPEFCREHAKEGMVDLVHTHPEVVSFDLPQGLYAHNVHVTAKSAERGSEGAVVENFGIGLNVVHRQEPAGPAGDEDDVGPVGRLPSKLSEGDGDGNGIAYSIVTRVVEQYSGPNKLQVQVRYGGAIEDMLEIVPNPADAPGWPSTPSSQQIHQGGREIMLDVMFCSPENDLSAEGLDFYLGSPRLPHRHGVLPQRAGQTARTKGRAEPASFGQQQMEGRHESAQNGGAVALRGGARALATSGNDDVEVVVGAQADECDPYDGGDEWCDAAISFAERRALNIQETDIYCSRECQERGALWCNIFGKRNCRMCSEDCDSFCQGKTSCGCHPCPVSGATETWACSVGESSACYDQITESDYKSLMISQQRMQCAWSCLRNGGFWCQAFGIDGCRFCSLDCDDYCSSIGAVFGEDCDCIQCPDDLEDPPFEMTTDTNEEDYQSCADADDGDTFCVEQASEETHGELETQGMSLQCHEECYPGVAWPVWCFAEETVGCRYCKENCDDLCGEGVTECNSCYTCEGSYSGSYSFEDSAQ